MNRRHKLGAIAVAACCSLSPAWAEAKVLDVYGSLKGGLVTGSGTNTLGPNAADYFEIERGPALGFELGAEIMAVDFIVNGTRMFDTRPNEEAGVKGGSGGTYFQFLVGIDGDFALDSNPNPATFLRVGGNAGVGLGLHRAVQAPLDNSQVSAKGLVANGVLALDHHLSKVFVVGLEVMPGYHVFFPGGAEGDQGGDSHSRGFHLMTYAFLQFHLDPLSWGEKKSSVPPAPRHEFLPLESNEVPARPQEDDEDEDAGN